MTAAEFSHNTRTWSAAVALNGNSVRAETDEEVRRIASALASHVDELAQSVASAVRAEVDFYKSTGVVTDDELLASSTDNLQFALKGLEAAAEFDTSPAVATGSKRAAAGVPLPAVMDAYRVASHHIWDAVVQIVTTRADISRDVLIGATKRIRRLQDAYTDAMTGADRQQITHQVLEDEAERAALTEALLTGAPSPTTPCGKSPSYYACRFPGRTWSSLPPAQRWASRRFPESPLSCAAPTSSPRGAFSPTFRSASPTS